MRSVKTLAVLSGLAISMSLLPSLALADTRTVSHPAEANAKKLDPAFVDRTYSLDELFKVFTSPESRAATVHTLPQKPAIHGTPHPKAVVGAAAKSSKPASKTFVAVNKAKPAATKTQANPQSAMSKIESSGGDILAVAHTTSATQCAVVSASLDRPGPLPKYKAGEQMTVDLRAKADCNVIVFDYDSQGKLTQIFPNQFEQNGALHAGETVRLGGPNSKYTLEIGGKGLERIFVYAYPMSDAQITLAMNPVPKTPFRSADITPEQYMRLVKQSKEFFAGGRERSVTVKAKPATEAAAATEPSSGNKMELVFQIEN